MNLTYGTAKVLPALDALADAGIAGAAGDGRARRALARRGAAPRRRLERQRRPERPAPAPTLRAVDRGDGAGGGRARRARRAATAPRIWCPSAAAWPGCATATDDGRDFPAAPIGLYFARLWYSEALYPLIFTVAAIQAAGARRWRGSARAR